MLGPKSLALNVCSSLRSHEPVEGWTPCSLKEFSAALCRTLPTAVVLCPTSKIGQNQYANTFHQQICLEFGLHAAASLPYCPATTTGSIWELLIHRLGLARLHKQSQTATKPQYKPETTSPSAAVVCVVAKLPLVGRSKTRLAASLQQARCWQLDRGAADSFVHGFAQSSLLDTMEKVHREPTFKVVWAMPALALSADNASDLQQARQLLLGGSCPDTPVIVVSPSGELETNTVASLDNICCFDSCSCSSHVASKACSLGSMLSVTCSHLAAATPTGVLVLLGMDTPHIPLETIQQACMFSKEHGCAVLLPSTDGGYVCCVLPAASVLANTHACVRLTSGAGHPLKYVWRCGALFDDVGLAGCWSTSRALQAQAECLEACGLPVKLLTASGGGHLQHAHSFNMRLNQEGYTDVDTWDDLLRCKELLTTWQTPRVCAQLQTLEWTEHDQSS